MRVRVACFAALAVLVFASRADAYRPFDGTEGDVAEFGELELEMGPAWARPVWEPTENAAVRALTRRTM